MSRNIPLEQFNRLVNNVVVRNNNYNNMNNNNYNNMNNNNYNNNYNNRNNNNRNNNVRRRVAQMEQERRNMRNLFYPVILRMREE